MYNTQSAQLRNNAAPSFPYFPHGSSAVKAANISQENSNSADRVSCFCVFVFVQNQRPNVSETILFHQRLGLRNKMKALTCVVLKALAGVASLSAAAHTVGSTGFRVAEINLRLAVVSCEACGTAAAQPSDGMDGPEQDGI